jgi:hypothetical protein
VPLRPRVSGLLSRLGYPPVAGWGAPQPG